MSKTSIDGVLWNIERILMTKHGCDAAERMMTPLMWYVNTGRASALFLRLLCDEKPFLIARDLAKGGSIQDAVDRICKRIHYTTID